MYFRFYEHTRLTVGRSVARESYLEDQHPGDTGLRTPEGLKTSINISKYNLLIFCVFIFIHR